MYKEEFIKAMNLLSQNPKVLFIGPGVKYSGHIIFETLKDVPVSQKIELPIVEEMQMVLSIGLSLYRFLPVSIYPRMDFLIIASNQLINHLDKIEGMSMGQWRPKVIIRTMIGNTKPLYPGLQHCQDHTEALKILLKNIDIVKLETAEQIVPAYMKAMESERSTILIEKWPDT